MTYNMSNNGEYDPSHPGFGLLFDESAGAVGGLLQSEFEAAPKTTTTTIQSMIGSYAPANSGEQQVQTQVQQQQPQQGKKRKLAPSCEKKATKRKPAAAAVESSLKRPDTSSYEELSECAVALGASADRLVGRSWPDKKLRGDVDRAENLLASAKSELERMMRELACVMCRRSPTERPLIARGQCGHSFCCLSCLSKYVADHHQGSFECLRCGAMGPVTLLQL